jgi:hypothetical protein
MLTSVRRLGTFATLALALGGVACSSNDADDIKTTGRFRAEAWADNWFSLSVGDKQVFEDSVPITTEKSFNKEVFGFDGEYPLVLGFVLKDYKANDSGLEYIGTDKQQMGDGGFIAQITDTTTGKLVSASSAAWSCLVVHRAPLNVECEGSADPAAACQSEVKDEPAGWKTAGFDASAWPKAIEYSAEMIGAKDGYDEVSWDASARLLWSSSLQQDNTLLCRVVVTE